MIAVMGYNYLLGLPGWSGSAHAISTRNERTFHHVTSCDTAAPLCDYVPNLFELATGGVTNELVCTTRFTTADPLNHSRLRRRLWTCHL